MQSCQNPALDSPLRLRFKSNIPKIIGTDTYRTVGDITGFRTAEKAVVHGSCQIIFDADLESDISFRFFLHKKAEPIADSA